MWSMQAVVQPPEGLKAFPGARRSKRKTPMAGAGLRQRWKDDSGVIFECDYRHGHVEVYDRRGHHRGGFDPDSGERVSEAVDARRVEP